MLLFPIFKTKFGSPEVSVKKNGSDLESVSVLGSGLGSGGVSGFESVSGVSNSLLPTGCTELDRKAPAEKLLTLRLMCDFRSLLGI